MKALETSFVDLMDTLKKMGDILLHPANPSTTSNSKPKLSVPAKPDAGIVKTDQKKQPNLSGQYLTASNAKVGMRVTLCKNGVYNDPEDIRIIQKIEPLSGHNPQGKKWITLKRGNLSGSMIVASDEAYKNNNCVSDWKIV